MERHPFPGRSAAEGLGLSLRERCPALAALNVIDNGPEFIYRPVFFSDRRNRNELEQPDRRPCGDTGTGVLAPPISEK